MLFENVKDKKNLNSKEAFELRFSKYNRKGLVYDTTSRIFVEVRFPNISKSSLKITSFSINIGKLI
jgi:hypothetical protein